MVCTSTSYILVSPLMYYYYHFIENNRKMDGFVVQDLILGLTGLKPGAFAARGRCSDRLNYNPRITE